MHMALILEKGGHPWKQQSQAKIIAHTIQPTNFCLSTFEVNNAQCPFSYQPETAYFTHQNR